MIQCPQCFSWINDSVTDVCPNCGRMAFPPMERPVYESSPDRPVIPALGQSVRSMIAGIVAVYLAGFSWLMTASLWDRSANVELFISAGVFIAILWLPAVILGTNALRGAQKAIKVGNRTRMARVGCILGIVSLTIGGAALLTTLAAILYYAVT